MSRAASRKIRAADRDRGRKKVWETLPTQHRPLTAWEKRKKENTPERIVYLVYPRVSADAIRVPVGEILLGYVGMYDNSDTSKFTAIKQLPQNGRERLVYESEQRIINWLNSNVAKSVQRIGRIDDLDAPAPSTLPDLVVDDRTAVIKTVHSKESIVKRAAWAVLQSRMMIFDARGADGRNLVGEKDIEAGMRQAVQDYGMNIDLIIVFNNDATLFWEAES